MKKAIDKGKMMAIVAEKPRILCADDEMRLRRQLVQDLEDGGFIWQPEKKYTLMAYMVHPDGRFRVEVLTRKGKEEFASSYATISKSDLTIWILDAANGCKGLLSHLASVQEGSMVLDYLTFRCKAIMAKNFRVLKELFGLGWLTVVNEALKLKGQDAYQYSIDGQKFSILVTRHTQKEIVIIRKHYNIDREIHIRKNSNNIEIISKNLVKTHNQNIKFDKNNDPIIKRKSFMNELSRQWGTKYGFIHVVLNL